VRERLQRAVNRLLYGDRDDPYRVLASLGQRLEGTLAPETTLATIVQTVVETLRLPYAGIVVRQEGQQRLAAAHRASAERGMSPLGAEAPEPPPAHAIALPLVYRQEQVGKLIVAPRPGEAELSQADQHLLQALARQAGNAVHALELTMALQARMEDLRRSRERLFVAQEEERRRVQRDLHDGLGPLLVSMRMHLEVCRERADIEAPQLQGSLERLDGLLSQATTDIRRLVHNLRPPALDQIGLVQALEQYIERYSAETSIAVELQAAPMSLSAAAEVAIYRIVLESLNNIRKYAGARAVTLRLAPIGDALLLSMHDDGVGGAVEGRTARGGMGIVGMRERAELLGGTLVLHSPPGGGTTLEVYLPIRDATADEEVSELVPAGRSAAGSEPG
jgi:signal transduction histidine kinase